MLYDQIARRKPVREGYLDHLLELGKVTREDADAIAAARREQLERELSVARSDEYRAPSDKFAGVWSGYAGGRDHDVEEADTAVPAKRLSAILAGLAGTPKGFHLHPKIERGLKQRREMAEGKRALDWSAGEALAFGSLVQDGVRVRLTGQDTARGTFTQRHSVLFDIEDGHTYTPLGNVAKDQAPFEVFNSPLSEVGVMGFEYGYSLESPDVLVLWEAQFGDFANAGQVIIDQFLAAAESKWRRLSGLVLLLPHGMEGQGPEHSSARLERFLSLAADDNMQIVYPTTPAQYFHVLRRQVLRRWRKPLVVMTPKSLLRNPEAISSLSDLAAGGFQRVIPDPVDGEVRRVLLCSGKVYYDLDRLRREIGRADVALVRVEQLYPWPEEALSGILAAHPGAQVVWVQEEPENMGAWRFVFATTRGVLGGRPLSVVCRPAAASPATGSGNSHRLEQNIVLVEALG
jgi:2-oxoglutarate dehydrogenase E1 component